jgi:hypothetical protein
MVIPFDLVIRTMRASSSKYGADVRVDHSHEKDLTPEDMRIEVVYSRQVEGEVVWHMGVLDYRSLRASEESLVTYLVDSKVGVDIAELDQLTLQALRRRPKSVTDQNPGFR